MTAAPQGRQAEAQPQRSSGVVWGVVGVVAGAVVATIATWALLSGELGPFARWLDSVLNLLLAALGGFGVALLLALPLTWWWLRRFVGTAQGTLGRVVSDAAAATRAAAENDAAAAVSHTERALHEAAAWYAPIAARRFVVQTLITLLVTFGGLVGTGLLFRQTLLLGKQNEKLDEQTALLRDQNAKLDLQTVTAEAQRRGGLTAELFSILQKVSDIGDAGERGTEPLRLPSGLTARIVAFSRAAPRYWTAEVPESGYWYWTAANKGPVPRLADRPRSPERGQLLAGLVAAGVYFPALTKAGATFNDADLRGADLRDAFLGNADLRGADLNDAFLGDADLRGANLTSANLSGASLYGTDLRDADLISANLRGTNLYGANLRGAKLTIANLSGAHLEDADLDGAIVG